MLEAPCRCKIRCFLLANCDGINKCNAVSYKGRFLRSMISKRYRNAFERCAPSGPQKHITNKSDWFYNHSNLYTVVEQIFSESNLNLNTL